MFKKGNKASILGGKARWKKTKKKDRTEQMRALAFKRHKKLSPSKPVRAMVS